MIDIVPVLRRAHPQSEDGELQHQAADEIEWLRGERNRLAADLAKAHKDAVAWMEKVHQPADEITRLRARVHTLSTTCGHCGDLERAWAEAAAARREGIEAAAQVALRLEVPADSGPIDGHARVMASVQIAHNIRALLTEGGR